MIDSNNLTIINNLTSSFFDEVRDIIFINDGQIMTVASTNNQYLLYFNRSDNYSFIKSQFVTYSYPHGLRYINDSYFYVTSWGDNKIYSYSALNNNLTWLETLFIDATTVTSTSGGDHLIIDDCDRYWFSLGGNGLRIYDNQGFLITNVTQMTPFIFDTLITDNYVIYLSDTISNRITRIDPNIQC